MIAMLAPLAALCIAFLFGFAAGWHLAVTRGQASQDEGDEHAQWPGADAGFSNHVGGK